MTTMNKQKRKTRKVYDEKLLYTWEKLSDIEAQYNNIESRLSEESELIVKYVNTLPEFNRKIFFLYTEYNSYRKVSYETNCGKDVIMNIVRKIKNDIKNGKHHTHSK